jgi:hypothetical protein
MEHGAAYDEVCCIVIVNKGNYVHFDCEYCNLHLPLPCALSPHCHAPEVCHNVDDASVLMLGHLPLETDQ